MSNALQTHRLQHTRLLCPSLSPKSLPKLLSVELVMLSTHLILCGPLLLLLSIFPSIRIFSDELALHMMWPKYWSFRFSISPSNEYSGLTSFGIDWFGQSNTEQRGRKSYRAESLVTTAVETGVMLPQATECQESPEAGKGQKEFSLRTLSGSLTLLAL